MLDWKNDRRLDSGRFAKPKTNHAGIPHTKKINSGLLHETNEIHWGKTMGSALLRQITEPARENSGMGISFFFFNLCEKGEQCMTCVNATQKHEKNTILTSWNHESKSQSKHRKKNDLTVNPCKCTSSCTPFSGNSLWLCWTQKIASDKTWHPMDALTNAALLCPGKSKM
jgi:hypothetical protein